MTNTTTTGLAGPRPETLGSSLAFQLFMMRAALHPDRVNAERGPAIERVLLELEQDTEPLNRETQYLRRDRDEAQAALADALQMIEQLRGEVDRLRTLRARDRAAARNRTYRPLERNHR